MNSTDLTFGDLDGWASDDLSEAFSVFRVTAADVPGWGRIAAQAAGAADARAFFEGIFRPVLIDDDAPGLFTGYYEPELAGSRVRTAEFVHPVYALPEDARTHDRAAIVTGALAGRGLEIAWLEDAAEAFFLQVQGSGRIVFPDGVLRVNFAGGNGRAYRSIGKELVAQGVFTVETVTAEGIKDWIRANPEEGARLMDMNPSWVFFRVVDVDPGLGPLGCMGKPVTAMRSVAVDPAVVPLGAPVWVEAGGFRRLMVAQDKGGAIKGAQRADIFFGTGAEAGRAAGAFHHGGRMVVLMPREGEYLGSKDGQGAQVRVAGGA